MKDKTAYELLVEYEKTVRHLKICRRQGQVDMAQMRHRRALEEEINRRWCDSI
jgi:hypothetical protein